MARRTLAGVLGVASDGTVAVREDEGRVAGRRHGARRRLEQEVRIQRQRHGTRRRLKREVRLQRRSMVTG